MTAATVRVRLKSGAARTFHATDCELVDGLVMATGRWGDAPRTMGSYVWPARQIVSVRWAVSHV